MLICMFTVWSDCRSWSVLTHVWWKVYSFGSTWMQVEGICAAILINHDFLTLVLYIVSKKEFAVILEWLWQI